MIAQTQCTSFKKELYIGIHVLTTDTLNIALYAANASLDENTAVYTTTGEISGTGYTAGGATLTNVTVNSSAKTAYVSFDNPSWSGTLTARGALIYNASKANRAIAVLDFGSNKTSITSFTITMPPNMPTTALIRSSN